LAFVDERNLVGAAKTFNRRLEWNKLAGYLANSDQGRDLVEMAVYVGLPPNTEELQEKREKKLRFVHALRKQGHMVITKDGSPAGQDDHGHSQYKANVDVLMAIDSMDLAAQIQPDVVVLVTGDADFAHLATSLRRRGIRVEVAAIAQTLGEQLKVAANSVIDLRELFNSFENLHPDNNGGRIGDVNVFDD
jgi:uncharacterized LabA/DUF88 family protein